MSLNARLHSLDAEIHDVDDDIERLQVLRARLRDERQDVLRRIAAASAHHRDRDAPMRSQILHGIAIGAGGTANANANANANGAPIVDYQNDGFEWSLELAARMKRVFGINAFRLCQRGYVARVNSILISRFSDSSVEYAMRTWTGATSCASCPPVRFDLTVSHCAALCNNNTLQAAGSRSRTSSPRCSTQGARSSSPR